MTIETQYSPENRHSVLPKWLTSLIEDVKENRKLDRFSRVLKRDLRRLRNTDEEKSKQKILERIKERINHQREALPFHARNGLSLPDAAVELLVEFSDEIPLYDAAEMFGGFEYPYTESPIGDRYEPDQERYKAFQRLLQAKQTEFSVTELEIIKGFYSSYPDLGLLQMAASLEEQENIPNAVVFVLDILKNRYERINRYRHQGNEVKTSADFATQTYDLIQRRLRTVEQQPLTEADQTLVLGVVEGQTAVLLDSLRVVDPRESVTSQVEKQANNIANHFAFLRRGLELTKDPSNPLREKLETFLKDFMRAYGFWRRTLEANHKIQPYLLSRIDEQINTGIQELKRVVPEVVTEAQTSDAYLLYLELKNREESRPLIYELEEKSRFQPDEVTSFMREMKATLERGDVRSIRLLYSMCRHISVRGMHRELGESWRYKFQNSEEFADILRQPLFKEFLTHFWSWRNSYTLAIGMILATVKQSQELPTNVNQFFVDQGTLYTAEEFPELSAGLTTSLDFHLCPEAETRLSTAMSTAKLVRIVGTGEKPLFIQKILGRQIALALNTFFIEGQGGVLKGAFYAPDDEAESAATQAFLKGEPFVSPKGQYQIARDSAFSHQLLVQLVSKANTFAKDSGSGKVEFKTIEFGDFLNYVGAG